MQAHAYAALGILCTICVNFIYSLNSIRECTRTQDVVIHFTCIKPNNNKFKRCMVNYGCACAEIYAASDLKLCERPY